MKNAPMWRIFYFKNYKSVAKITMGYRNMASNIKTPELSPRQALTNIRQRMEAAIEEGKKKAGVSVKTEAVFEGAGETTNKYDDDIDFGEWDQPSEPSANTNNKYDDDIDFGESSQPSEVQATANNKYDDNIDFDKPVATGGKGNVPAKEAVPEQPSVFASKKPRRLSREEREANEKRLREFEQQRNAEWNYSKAEISTEMKSLFSLADENREYLNPKFCSCTWKAK